MTAMIDVMFLLLIFFICTTHFNPLEETLPMDMSLPGSVVAEVALPDPTDLDFVRIQISFDRTPHWQIEGNQCFSLLEVQRILRTIRDVKSDIPVIIESAANVPMENVIDVYDVCRSVGLSQIQFAVSPAM